ncbi:MAG: phosphatase PAP2 family protein [Bacteroidia bacterium]|nr:phosphatase PAP2 family protein [Bacteroidia bacterium]
MKKALFLLSFLSLQLNAQDTLTGLNKVFLKSLFYDVHDIVRTPFHSENRSLLIGAGVVSIVTASFLLDDEMNHLVRKNRNDDAEFWFNYMANPIGNLYGFTFVAGWYFKGIMEKDNRSKNVALNAAKAVLINTVISQAVKRTMKRDRPFQLYDADADDSFNPFEDDKTNDSFYSGHTSTAFAIATVFADEYKEHKWVPYLAYGLATSAASARIYLNKHWISDVAAGAAIGYYIGKVISNGKNRKYQLSFVPGNKILFSLSF